jgi:hypothetical protein
VKSTCVQMRRSQTIPQSLNVALASPISRWLGQHGILFVIYCLGGSSAYWGTAHLAWMTRL